jgi:hypothetical protein
MLLKPTNVMNTGGLKEWEHEALNWVGVDLFGQLTELAINGIRYVLCYTKSTKYAISNTIYQPARCRD